MKEVLDYLLDNELVGVSKTVDIAKGKNELVFSFKEVKEKIKRIWQLKK